MKIRSLQWLLLYLVCAVVIFFVCLLVCFKLCRAEEESLWCPNLKSMEWLCVLDCFCPKINLCCNPLLVRRCSSAFISSNQCVWRSVLQLGSFCVYVLLEMWTLQQARLVCICRLSGGTPRKLIKYAAQTDCFLQLQWPAGGEEDKEEGWELFSQQPSLLLLR